MEEKYYDVAAQWWADRVRKLNEGVKIFTEQEEDIDIATFKKLLAEEIHTRVSRSKMLILSTKYTENAVLEKVCDISGVDMVCLPWNTNMWIKETCIAVSVGGETVQKIFEIP